MSRRQTPGLASPRSVAIVALQTANRGRPESGPAVGPPESALKLVAAYARVSSDKQEKEQTIDSQVDALRRAAEERGWHLLPDLICTDDGRSGATLARPGLDRLRDLIAEGTCAAVLVCSPDRLARNYAYQVLVIDEFRRAGCEAVFLNHAFGASPEQQMLLQMQGVFAEYERALITERTRRGRLFWARQGRVNWGGTPTYGYRLLRGTETGPQQLVVEEREAAGVRQMYRWLVEEQLSSYQPVDEVQNWPSTHNMSRPKLRMTTLCSGLIAEQRLRQRAANRRSVAAASDRTAQAGGAQTMAKFDYFNDPTSDTGPSSLPPPFSIEGDTITYSGFTVTNLSSEPKSEIDLYSPFLWVRLGPTDDPVNGNPPDFIPLTWNNGK